MRVIGRVLLPEGITRAEACSGRVRVVVRRGGRAIERRTRALGNGCRFRVQMRIAPMPAKARVKVRFLGNTTIAARSAPTRAVVLRRR